MEKTGRYILMAILAAIFLPITSCVTVAHFPCLSYPSAYFKTRDLGEKIENFHSKHGHLPNPSLLEHAAEFNLDPGYTFDFWVHDYTYTLRISPEIDPDYKDQSLLPFKMGFDMPWVVYNAKSKSISCGHR